MVDKSLVQRARSVDFRKLLQTYKISIVNEKWFLCPFHSDKSPSCNFDSKRGIYYCFSCGARGNVLTFVRNYEKISFDEAVIRLLPLASLTYSTQTSVIVDKNRELLLQSRRELDKLFFPALQLLDVRYDTVEKRLTEEATWDFVSYRSLLDRAEMCFDLISCCSDFFNLKKQLTDLHLGISKNVKKLILEL